MQKLISNTLSPEELDELLAAMQEQEVQEEMSDFLEKYFEKLMARFDKRDGSEKEF
ncbi:MAG: hypothetical protein LRY55_15105 [Leadbetterella sp.]|nr:hypothetical protein [Leadbetterella sp.]